MDVNSIKPPLRVAAVSLLGWFGIRPDARVRRESRRFHAIGLGQEELSLRLARLGARVQAVQVRLGKLPFHSGMTIEEALARHPGAAGTFSLRHLPACHLCAVRFDETVAEAADAYGIPLEEWLQELNSLLS
jgi:hypothetical protein